jgi:WhiB family redox-sensing transcriptional regulator
MSHDLRSSGKTATRTRRTAIGDAYGWGDTWEEPWQLRAACRGPQAYLFFPPSQPERKDERDIRESRAKAICASCGVRDECLAFALDTREQHGIWGGKNEVERRAMLTVV